MSAGLPQSVPKRFGNEFFSWEAWPCSTTAVCVSGGQIWLAYVCGLTVRSWISNAICKCTSNSAITGTESFCQSDAYLFGIQKFETASGQADRNIIEIKRKLVVFYFVACTTYWACPHIEFSVEAFKQQHQQHHEQFLSKDFVQNRKASNKSEADPKASEAFKQEQH